ncbi:Protein N-acetyltransferase, RimJ/RimL family [Aliiroseovarius halocynthiae]|uniref:GNAT family N-acetyltransferase n=1 Tax=Aliiroseovarius halocynthiae TaxID=985055 RepID=A0A545SW01_9RHOB|nr:GNAT family N-acetyltransferase [Aliiroseovarius halocynthiae]TQV69137.1 GNAT family N-acetyltransferase [Aliiroseovarius halocynthiae]SMR71893.1 Protein N-acetyltransferase, RimJ/RimL family [Aliiroseovarius halocynthiae]
MEQDISIRTERFTLRPLTPADGDQVVLLLDDFEVARWLTVVPHPYTHADYDRFLGYLAGTNPLGGLAIDDGTEVLGVVGIDPTLGYWLGRKHHGKGVMPEAAAGLIAHVFATTDLDQIGSGHFPDNQASRAVLTGLGFRDTGETETAHCVSRKCDEVLIKLRLSRADWEARQ